MKSLINGTKQYFSQLYTDITDIPTLKKMMAITVVVPSVMCGLTFAVVSLIQ